MANGERFVGFAGFSLSELFLGAAPADPGYSAGLEAALALVLRDMSPERKLALAHRMQTVFRDLERQARAELGEPEQGG